MGEGVNGPPSTRGRILGVGVIAALWVAGLIVLVVVGGLLLLWADGKYAPGPERTEVVAVVKLRAMASDTAGAPLSETYVVRFPSGGEGKVTFPPGAGLSSGERIRLKYRRSRVLGAIVANGFERISAE